MKRRKVLSFAVMQLLLLCHCDSLMLSRFGAIRAPSQSFRLTAAKHGDTVELEVPRQQQQQLHKTTPLARFNSQVNHKREGVSITAIDPSGYTCDDLSSIPTVRFLDLMYMAFASSTSDEMYDKRRQLFEMVKSKGSYCMVEMDDIEASILDGMWSSVDHLFRAKEVGTPAALRRQTLTRENRVSPEEEPQEGQQEQGNGYDYVQTTIVRNEIYPLTIGEALGSRRAQQARDAYLLLSQLSKAYAVVLYAGVTNKSPLEATKLIESLVDEEDRSFSGSYHRLCNYVRRTEPTTDVSGGKHADSSSTPCSWGESLRSHVDWTLSTSIPVSAIAGLEIYDPSLKRWVRPELTARQKWQKQEQNHQRNEGDELENLKNNVTRQLSWNTHYVVVMAGAWLELLTQGRLESTLHRVVMDLKAKESRQSAPFFMRPREHVFEKTNQVFDNRDDAAVMALVDPNEAVIEMSRFLHGLAEERSTSQLIEQGNTT